jgi:hypothetical protein
MVSDYPHGSERHSPTKPKQPFFSPSITMEVTNDMCEERNPNDDRSDSLNPNNDSHQASQDNRANQMNPNNSRYQGK